MLPSVMSVARLNLTPSSHVERLLTICSMLDGNDDYGAPTTALDHTDAIDTDRAYPTLLCNEVFTEPSPSTRRASSDVPLLEPNTVESSRTCSPADRVRNGAHPPVVPMDGRHPNDDERDGRRIDCNDGGSGTARSDGKDPTAARAPVWEGGWTVGAATDCAVPPRPPPATKKRGLFPMDMVGTAVAGSTVAGRKRRGRGVPLVRGGGSVDGRSLEHPSNGNGTSIDLRLTGGEHTTDVASHATRTRGDISENAPMRNSQYLAYPWDSLGLGESVGSVALNEYIDRAAGNTGAQAGRSNLSPHQTLQIMESLRPKTVLPPPGTELYDIIKLHYTTTTTTAWEHIDTNPKPPPSPTKHEPAHNPTSPTPTTTTDRQNNNNNNNNAPPPSATNVPSPPPPPPLRLPLDSLQKLCESLQAQDEDDGTTERRRTQHLTADACVERMKSIENTVFEYRLRHERLMREGEELGLLLGGGGIGKGGR